MVAEIDTVANPPIQGTAAVIAEIRYSSGVRQGKEGGGPLFWWARELSLITYVGVPCNRGRRRDLVWRTGDVETSNVRERLFGVVDRNRRRMAKTYPPKHVKIYQWGAFSVHPLLPQIIGGRPTGEGFPAPSRG